MKSTENGKETCDEVDKKKVADLLEDGVYGELL